MKTTNETVYRCDFCNRAIVSKGSMVVHEKMCKNNPENAHKCFEFCNHLQRDKEIIGGYGDEDWDLKRTKFVCLIRDVELKSYKVKRTKKLMEYTKDIEFMPNECNLFEGKFDTIIDENENT